MTGNKVHIPPTILHISKFSKSRRWVKAGGGGGQVRRKYPPDPGDEGPRSSLFPGFPSGPPSPSFPKPIPRPPMAVSDSGISLFASVYTSKALGSCKPELWDGEVKPATWLLGKDADCARGRSPRCTPGPHGLPVWSDPELHSWLSWAPRVVISGTARLALTSSLCDQTPTNPGPCVGFGFRVSKSVVNKAMIGTEAQRGRPPDQGHTAHLQQS